MSQYLIAFCYLVTIFLLFLAFFIVRAVPSGSPFNIDLYRDNTIISFAIYNPAELQYRTGPPQEKVREHDWNTNWNEEDEVNNNWDDHESQANNEGWDHADDWTAGLGTNPNSTPLSGSIGFSLTSALTRSERSQDVSLRRTSGPSMKPNTESLSALQPPNLVSQNSKKNPSKKHRVSGK
jgi:hypothetical protein